MIPDKFVNISSVTHKCLNWFIKLSVFAAPFRSEIHSPRRPRAFSQSDEIDHVGRSQPYDGHADGIPYGYSYLSYNHKVMVAVGSDSRPNGVGRADSRPSAIYFAVCSE